MTIKPGYKTSEFWFTVVTFIFSGLYLLGVIGDHTHKEDLIRDISHGVESVILIGGQIAILFKYLNGRKQIKETYLKSESEKSTNGQPKSKQRTKSRAKSTPRKASKQK